MKRLPTIIGKLKRFKNMRLSSMQDIAGVRMIVSDMKQLKLVERHIRRWDSLIKVSDYISEPKESGYRGKHFVFEKDGMLVEVQLRTQIQHLWATAVETTDVFRGATLKEKNDGTYWHDFFCQVSAIFAIVERTKVVAIYDKLSLGEICEKLEDNMHNNKIGAQVASFALIEPIIDDKKKRGAYYAVVTLDFREKKASVAGYMESEYHLAFEDYRRQEQENLAHRQVVLVAVSQIKKIREAYPNYFMDLGKFLGIIDFLLEKNKEKR